jgi:hypothetical protein
MPKDIECLILEKHPCCADIYPFSVRCSAPLRRAWDGVDEFRAFLKSGVSPADFIPYTVKATFTLSTTRDISIGNILFHNHGVILGNYDSPSAPEWGMR